VGEALSAEDHADRRAYVQVLCDFARDDARQVYIRVTAALAIAALFVTQIRFKNVQALSDIWTVVLFVGVTCLIVAAFLYFLYVGDTHNVRRRIAKYLLDLESVEPSGDDRDNPADLILSELHKSRRWWAFWLADPLFAIGGFLLALVLAKMIWGPMVAA
jgi:hypothetical protein